MLLQSNHLHDSQSACTLMHSSLDREKAIAIAVNLLKHKNPRIVQTLKDLLTFVPNPNYTRDVLEAAVLELIYTSPQSALWLFQHPEVVNPHIHVRQIVAQELTQKLLSWKYTLEDFNFTSDYSLVMDKDIKKSLSSISLEVGEEPICALIWNLLML